MEEEGKSGEDAGDVPSYQPLVSHLAKGHGVYMREGCIALEFSKPLEAQNTEKHSCQADCETEEPYYIDPDLSLGDGEFWDGKGWW